jgi:hypothetical protein
MQYSIAVNNARLDAIESTTGVSAKLRLYTGAAPANCATAASGTMLCEMALPSDWMAAASGATKLKSGTWSGTGAAAGVAGYFRIVDNAGTTCHVQGTAGLTAAEMILDNTNIAVSLRQWLLTRSRLTLPTCNRRVLWLSQLTV